MGHLSENRITPPSRKAFLRFWAVLLSVVTVFSLLPAGIPTDAAEAPTLRISADGVETDTVYMTTRERVELSVQGVPEGAGYQWQILHPESDTAWISIFDGIRQELSVTMALAKNMLRPDGTVLLRCKVTAGEEILYSDPLTVHISEPQPVQAVRISQEPARQDTVSGAEGDEIPEFVTVTINYVRYDIKRDDDGKLVTDSEGNYVLEDAGQAFLPYIATLQGGSGINTTVANPTMVGYDAWFAGTKADSVTLNISSITQDVEYTVEYRPALVKYAVRYYTQNVYDDLYVEHSTAEGTGYTGATPPDDVLNKTIPGFTSLYYQPDSIAADGSTVFEVYYERDYYLMEFDCNGGYGTETLYIRYGSYISVPQPVKAGWVFGGWDLVYTEESGTREETEDGTPDTLEATIPAYNLGYKAVWNTTDTTYTVVYWTENANDGNYSYLAYSTVVADSNTVLDPLTVGRNQSLASIDGFNDAAHFTLNEERTRLGNPASVVVEGDGSTIINLYYTRNSYTLNFVWDEECIFEEHVHTDACYEYYCNSHTHTASCYLCGKDQHTHSNSCCTLTEHPSHTIACYTTDTDYTVVTNGTHWTRVQNIDSPEAGTVYRYRANNSYYNYLYDGTNWYFLGSGNDYCGITVDGITNPSNGNYTSGTPTIICNTALHTHGIGCTYGCNKELHTHNEICYKCGKLEHTHSDSCCSIAYHTHSIVCYKPNNGYSLATNENDGYTTLTAIANPQVGYVYRYRRNNNNYYNYFYDGTNWYYLGDGNQYCGLIDSVSNPTQNGRYNSAKADNTISCGETVHDHTSGCDYDSCTTPVHVHDADCYICGENHVHTALCDIHLKCLLTEHTHTNNCSLIYSITAKYDADITRIWEEDPIASYLEDGVVWQSSVTSKYYSFLEKMPGQDIDLTYTEWSGNTYTWYYYLEVAPYETIPDEDLHTADGRTYKLYHTTSVNGNNISLTYEEDYFPITGYSRRDSSVPSFSNRTAALYYTINSHTLEYFNYSAEGPTPGSQTLFFGESLSDYQISEAEMMQNYYPKNLEPGAYEFGGWYTSPGCYDGSEVDWENGTMPDGDYIIYAKWTPILRNVTFYKYYDEIGTDAEPFLKAENVPHGELLGSTYNRQPEADEGYRFIGWFYMDEDNKKRFAPDSMEITRDLILFAEWTTSIDTTYQVEYVLKEDVSADATPSGTAYKAGDTIAAPDFNHITVGKTKTFLAKGGTQLDPDFREKFFPTTNSHSILMKENGADNTYRFEYVYDPLVYYKIRYVDYVTRTELRPSVTEHTEKAIVTEKFLPIEGYMPTSFYVTKALVSDGDSNGATIPEENVLTFYYIQDTEHGMFSIEHYLENADSTDSSNTANYTLYESEVGSADVNTTKTADVRNYKGFAHFDVLDTVVTYENTGTGDNPVYEEVVTTGSGNLSGEITYMGLTIKIYYKRLEYPYVIEYREYGAAEGSEPLKKLKVDGNPVGDPLPTQKYDSALTHTAEESFTLDGVTYEFYIPDSTEEQRTQTTSIRVADENDPNKLIFYYTQKKIPVHYIPVCTEETTVEFGAVSIASESATSANRLGGCTPIPASGFVFDGWFHDKACTNPVDPAWVDANNRLTPKQFTLDESQDEDYYYALFSPVKRDLTIKKEGVTGTTDSFLFTVTGKNVLDQQIQLTVSIQGSGEVTVKDLYCGEYTVTELTDWSWTYTAATASQTAELTVAESDPKVLTFTNSYQTPDWLTGETSKENHFS